MPARYPIRFEEGDTACGDPGVKAVYDVVGESENVNE